MILTKKDIENLTGIFVTKDEFNEFKNMVLTNFDKLFKMFETWRDENAIAVHKAYSQDRILENHEKRLGSLEMTISKQ